MVLEHRELKYKGAVVFEKMTLSTFDRLPKFYKDNEACFLFVNEGEFNIRTPNELLIFKKGKGLLSKCLDYFFETNSQQRTDSNRFEIIGVLLYPSIVEELFQFDISTSEYSVDYNAKKIEIDGLLNGFKESINTLLEHPELADEALIKMKLKEFVLLICKTLKMPSQLDFLAALFKKNEISFKETIRKNLYSNLSLNEFAHLSAMSLSSFKRKFKSIYNENPRGYFIKMKLEKSIELLNNKSTRISDIAYDCGFETISTFNRSFKKAYGKSPSEYRLN